MKHQTDWRAPSIEAQQQLGGRALSRDAAGNPMAHGGAPLVECDRSYQRTGREEVAAEGGG
jgi:hypothetical protein